MPPLLCLWLLRHTSSPGAARARILTVADCLAVWLSGCLDNRLSSPQQTGTPADPKETPTPGSANNSSPVNFASHASSLVPSRPSRLAWSCLVCSTFLSAVLDAGYCWQKRQQRHAIVPVSPPLVASLRSDQRQV
ncbi:hypothetical protein PICMEDRAFT_62944 [Pichia membranifaciens NRRL Y-2026]|uniref:Secreted protein n=1 Tax=Pichia membranifaciens NRRL Y-2026 TaxID=763406 RepID=A0A1E3NQX0_9ASCO|nr:hypothetical protein PICMEDRAFT_62944 [Pichia membranifaciens NRRL Y-2026]ODQ48098.1 hypothetical protein PICMEDRAFT_62944 [Pichia membranifaciens NRRL Y-2026]